jgi:glycosyltransferase involved in cell wall biosynthesis
VDLPESFRGLSGLEMDWVTLDSDVREPVIFEAMGTRFHVLPTEQTGRASSLYRKDLARLRESLGRLAPDLVHAWGTEDVYGLAAVRSGRPHLLSLQGIMSYYALKSRMNPRDYFQALLELYCLRRAAWVSVESEWGRRIVNRRRGNRPMAVIEYGVQAPFFKTEWRPSPHQPRAVFIGTVDARKGADILVDAFSEVKPIDARLSVAGGGHQGWIETLRRKAGSRVSWLGPQTRDQVRSLLAEAWCLVLPTKADTSPNVVKEARVIGLPVITTPEGGQEAHVRNGEDGWLVPAGDVNALRAALENLLGNFSAVQTMGLAGRQRYREIFRPGRTAGSFHELYGRILSPNRT